MTRERERVSEKGEGSQLNGNHLAHKLTKHVIWNKCKKHAQINCPMSENGISEIPVCIEWNEHWKRRGLRVREENRQIRWLFTRNQHKYLPTYIVTASAVAGVRVDAKMFFLLSFSVDGCWLNWWWVVCDVPKLNTCELLTVIIVK